MIDLRSIHSHDRPQCRHAKALWVYDAGHSAFAAVFVFTVTHDAVVSDMQ